MMKFTSPNIAIGAALVSAFALGALAISYSSADRDDDVSEAKSEEYVSGGFSKDQESEIGEIVRAYLMENPQIILEAVEEYRRRQQVADIENARQTARANLDALLDPTHGFITDDASRGAKIAVIELYDYHCGFCKRAATMVKTMLAKEEDVKFVFRELPILREESYYAARASLAARKQDKFLDLHFAMMAADGLLTEERVMDIAKAQGLDLAKLKADIDSEEITVAIDESRALAEQLAIGGTPTFVIASANGEYVDVVAGFRAEEIRQMIKEARKAAS